MSRPREKRRSFSLSAAVRDIQMTVPTMPNERSVAQAGIVHHGGSIRRFGTQMNKQSKELSRNAKLWASRLYLRHGSAALKILDETGRRVDMTSARRLALGATRYELIRIIQNAAKIEKYKTGLSPVRRFLFWVMYKQPRP